MYLTLMMMTMRTIIRLWKKILTFLGCLTTVALMKKFSFLMGFLLPIIFLTTLFDQIDSNNT